MEGTLLSNLVVSSRPTPPLVHSAGYVTLLEYKGVFMKRRARVAEDIRTS